MAESDVSPAKVFNYICGNGGFADFSQLLKHPSPLAKKSDADSVILWFEKEKLARSFDSAEHGLVMTKNQYGKNVGIRINLKKQMCLKYATTESCKLASRCKFWHICKEFVEGTCKGNANCGRSHDFLDEDNKGKTSELGFEAKTSANLRSIIAGSLPQVCLGYLKSECSSNYCPYLHICSTQVLATPCHDACSLSHDFAHPHNKNVLEQFNFKPPRTSKIDVVRCNILVPKQQKPVQEGKIQQELARVHQGQSRRLEKERESRQIKTTPGGVKPGISVNSQTPSKVKGAKVVTPAGLIQEASKSGRIPSVPPAQQGTVPPVVDPLPDKVFNYICGKEGVATLSDLLQHPSPLAKKFSGPGKELDAKIWLQVQAHVQPDQSPRISLMENCDGEIVGARVKSKKKMCLSYASKGSCTKSTCQFWHVCKRYLEGKCSGDCGLSHDFHDEGNGKIVQKLGLKKHPSGTVKNIVANSLPQVCLKYLSDGCLSNSCPYLHICSLAAQGSACNCNLSHQFTDTHNMGILKQYELIPAPSKLNILYYNVLIPKKQRSFEDGKINLGSSSSSLPQTQLNMFGPQLPPLMSLPLKTELQDPEKSSHRKRGRRQRPRQRNRQSNQQGQQTGESQDGHEEDSSNSDSDNEDTEKPDLYSSSKFSVHSQKKELTRQSAITKEEMKGKKGFTPKQPPKPSSEEEHILGMHANEFEAAEENLINFSDDDWQGVDVSADDFFANSELLSQVDEILFDDWFGQPNVTGSLSQESAISSTSDQNTSSSAGALSDKSVANSVFQYICKEHNGQVSFSVISKHQELFPPEIIDIAAWFKENQNRFITIENRAGKIEALRAYNPKARICFRYLLAKKGCKDPKCFRYHVCNHYLANGVCPFGKKCRYSHSHNLKSPHNKNITRQLKLNSLSEEQLRILISASVPEVCLDYNNHSCVRGFRCNGLHICKNFVMKHCKKGENCPLNHQSGLETPEAKLVLGRYNLTKVPPHAVLGALLVRGTSSSRKTTAQPQDEKVKQKREVSRPPLICLDNLLGHCTKAPLCDQYHCSTPYMWQYNDPGSETDTWKTFTQSENEAIEQQFCDVNVTVAMLHIMISTPSSVLIDTEDGEIEVNFDDMKAVTSYGDVPLRRLSTKSAVLPTDHALSTQWFWYWLDETNSWREYGYEPMNDVRQDEIELNFDKGQSYFGFKIRDDEDHKLFFHRSPMYQQNMSAPELKKLVRRRPVFRSNSDIQKLQRPLELPVPLEPESPSLTTGPAPSRLPTQWTSVPESEEYIRVPLPTSSDQFKLAESLFRQSMAENKATIVAIERIQNPFMWEKYARKKELLEKRSRTKNNPVNEKLLFHGTDHQNVDSVCEENIDWRALDEGRAAAFGQGAYFTAEAALSNLYCKQDSESLRYMFLAEVLVGSFAKGEPSMKRPPHKSDSASKKELYDSCVDSVEKPTIYVLFDSDQYYPSFLIQYKIKSKVVC